MHEASLRRPVAMALGDNGARLFVANRQSGTISIIDTRHERVTAEPRIGARLSDVLVLSRKLLATDEDNGRLVICDVDGTNVVVRERVDVGVAPVSVRISPDESACFVALLWGRAIVVVELGKETAKLVSRIPLSFAPRSQLLIGSKLVVADSFGGRIAVIDVHGRKVESVRSLPAHNIRGMALSSDGRRLYLLHQKLNPLAQTTIDDIRWGNLIGNDLRALSVTHALDPQDDLLEDAELHSLGELENGFADPSAIVVAPDQQVFIGSSGTGQLLQADEADFKLSRSDAGKRLTALSLSFDRERLYAADATADQILVVDVATGKVANRIALGPERKKTAAETGEDLFYSGRLSHQGWLSCHSCHTDGHSNELLSDTLGDGNFGAPKRVLSLLGTADTGPWAWNGNESTLENQVRKSIETTMRGNATEDVVAALTAFLRMLKPAPAVPDSTRQTAVARGEALFQKQGCAKCHEAPAYTSSRSYDVGLADENGNTRFNPPSLRGTSQRTALFHDNRARSLGVAFNGVRHGLTEPLAEGDLADLLAFLATL